MSENTKVYVPNRSGHNYEPAREFGELIFITEGFIQKHKVNNLYRSFVDAMKDASPHDYFVLASLGVLNAIGCAVFARKTGRLNLLIFNSHNGKYEPKELDIDALLGDG